MGRQPWQCAACGAQGTVDIFVGDGAYQTVLDLCDAHFEAHPECAKRYGARWVMCFNGTGGTPSLNGAENEGKVG